MNLFLKLIVMFVHYYSRFMDRFGFCNDNPFKQKAFQFCLLFAMAPFFCGFHVFAETIQPFTVLENKVYPPSPVQGFSLYDGSVIVENERELRMPASLGAKLLYDAATIEQGAMAAELFLTKGEQGNIAFIVKVRDPGVGADAFHGMETGLFADEQRLILGLHRNNFEQLVSVRCSIPLDRWFDFKVEFDRTNYRVLIDGHEVAVLTDSQARLTDGKVGFRPWQRNVRIRNFRLQSQGESEQQIKFVEASSTIVPWPESLQSLANLPPIALVTHYPMTAPPAVGQDFAMARPRKWGCSIRVIDPANPEKEVKTIFRDPEGCIYDMNRSFDGKTLYFSYRCQQERFWNIWKINIDGTNLTQLTDGDYYDVSPCETPDGRIVFVSSRRFGHTVCQPGPSSNLFLMNADGSDIRCVSMNTLSDFSPQILPDGRVLFTRWEYIDRDLTYRQSLWTQSPDGGMYRLYFGNTIRDVGTFWQARPIPGSASQVVATFAPHHGYPHGMIGLIDRSYGVEGPKNKGFRYITREVPSMGDRSLEWAYRDPYPFSEELFLCAYGSGGQFVYTPENGGNSDNKYRVYLLNAKGEKRLLYEDREMSCYHPIPLGPQEKPPVLAAMQDMQTRYDVDGKFASTSQLTGTVFLADVYEGIENLIPRGSVKKLRIMEQMRKTEELFDRAFDQSPVMSYGTYYAKRNWGEVSIEEDGSAYFEVPALREIYFQILDNEGRELHRMTSAVQVMPGESVGCIGCHESRDTAPPQQGGLAMAWAKPVQKPVVPQWMLERERSNLELDAAVFDYPSIVQPVLDKYCVECHNGTHAEGGYDLTGDKTRYFSMSYDNLLGKSKSYRQHDMDTGQMLPNEAAKGKPMVHFYWLLWTPTEIHLPFQSGCYASRLPDFLTKEHCGQDIPLEDRQKVYLWIDANVPYYGTYAHSRPRSPGRRDLFTDVETGRYSRWFEENFNEVYRRRCDECHGNITDTTNWEGKYAWLNFSRPENSVTLKAHLGIEHGGRGIEPLQFRSTNDADYRKMLQAIETGKQKFLDTPTADMPKFDGQRSEP